jgi:hypothetical protein
MVSPLVITGAVHVTVAVPSPATALRAVGAANCVPAITLIVEATTVPLETTGVTFTNSDQPVVNPVMSALRAVCETEMTVHVLPFAERSTL